MYTNSCLGILKGSDDVDKAKVANARKTRENDVKLRAMLREIVWQLVMFVLFTWVIVGALDSNVYHQNQDIRNAFIEDAEVEGGGSDSVIVYLLELSTQLCHL